MPDSSPQGEREIAGAVTDGDLPLADDAVAALAGSGGSALLFWMHEHVLRLGLAAGAGDATRLETIREETAGLHLGARSGVLTRTAWCTGLGGAEIAAALHRIAPGAAVPDPAGALPGAPARPPDAQAAEAALRRLWEGLTWPGHIRHLVLSFVAQDGRRGCCPAPGAARHWPSSYRALRLQAVRDDGSILVHERLFDPEAAGTGTLDALCGEIAGTLAGDPAGRGGLAGDLPVVTGAGHGAVIFHELVGHLAEADQRGRASPELAGLAGVPAALVIRDSPLAADGPGHIAVDDEGVTPRTVTLLSEGRLRNSLHSRDTAAAAGQPATGNGRRQDFRHQAEPRMRNLVVGSGSCPAEALLDGIAEGLWISSCGPAWMDSGRDRFGLEVEAGRAIRGGRLAEPVRGVTVTGSVTAALRGIRAIADDFAVSPLVVPCGKTGVVRTGIAGPSVRFERLTLR